MSSAFESFRSPLIGISAMAQRDDHDEEYLVLNRVHDSVVADANPEARSPLERFRAGWARVLAQEGDSPSDPSPILMIDPLQHSDRRWPELDAVRHAQPRSALTSLHGMYK
jgi:hypothetical protein